jgi:adenosylmethionine-8-amino-7-oxononanoate aminotransferase
MNNPVWFPYTQMKDYRPAIEVVRAKGVYLHLANGQKLIDALASWWCVIHGYNHPELTAAAQEQLDQMSHVMLGDVIHPSAKKLAKKLVQITPSGLNHVFFADSGSVGVEVALKMALQFWHNRRQPNKNKLLALTKGYHGDTCGAMSVCDPTTGMHARFGGMVPPQLFVESPTSGFSPDEKTLQKEIDRLEQRLREHHDQLAAFILEPILQGAGGFNIYAPQYLHAARELCDRFDVLLIFDEVATGFGRTGKLFAADHAKITPDIMVLGKGLTAGYLSHSATLATTRIFDAFCGDDPGLALMHGPTFMGNPLACAIALKSIEIIERDKVLEKITRIEQVLHDQLLSLQSPKIKAIRVLGACGIIEVHAANDLEGLQAFAIKKGIWLRPFSHVVYTTPAYIIQDDQLLKITQTLSQWFCR